MIIEARSSQQQKETTDPRKKFEFDASEKPSRLPTYLALIFTGVRLSWTFVLISVVGIEFLINLGGLGQLINDLAERYDLPGTYASICFVILVSVAFFMALERLEAWLRPGR